MVETTSETIVLVQGEGVSWARVAARKRTEAERFNTWRLRGRLERPGW